MKKALLCTLLSLSLFAQTTPPPAPPQMQLPAFMCLDKTGPFVYGSFLFMQSSFNDAIITSKTTTVGTGGIGTNFSDKSLSFDFNPGLKLAVGMNLKHDIGWSPLFQWSYLHSSPSQSWSSDTNDLLTALTHDTTSAFPTIFGSDFAGAVFAKNVHARWNLNFNSFQFELGKDLPATPWFLSRMFAALKTIVVSNKLVVKYENLTSTNLIITYDWPNQKYTSSNLSWTIGPRIGSDAYFEIFKDFGLLTVVATYVYACMYDPKINEQVILPPAGASASVGRTEKTPQTNIAAGFDVYLGFNWGHCFKGKTYMNISAGYDFQYYGAVIDAFHSLALNGLNATLMFDF